jgi:hypothetical protein
MRLSAKSALGKVIRHGRGNTSIVVMPGLDPGIHSVAVDNWMRVTEWIAGSSPAMTTTVGAS